MFEWDPELQRCPNAYLADIWPMVRWWSDWETYKVLPYGGTDLMAQPQFVVDVIRRCTEASLEVTRKIEKKLEAQREKERRELERQMRRARRY